MAPSSCTRLAGERGHPLLWLHGRAVPVASLSFSLLLYSFKQVQLAPRRVCISSLFNNDMMLNTDPTHAHCRQRANLPAHELPPPHFDLQTDQVETLSLALAAPGGRGL